MAKKTKKKIQKKSKAKAKPPAKKQKEAPAGEVTPEVQAAIDRINFLVDKSPWTFDLNGHFMKNDNTDLPVAQYHYDELIRRLSDHVRTTIGLFSATREPDEKFEKQFGREDRAALVDGQPDCELIRGSCSMDCYNCAEDVEFLVNKKTRHVTITSKCPLPDGVPEYTVSLDVPSGKLVFANDFRQFYDANIQYDINRTIGCKRTTEAYAALGMFHTFVGNTCPGIYQKDDTIFVGTAKVDFDEDGGDDIKNYEKFENEAKKRTEAEFGKRQGAICTDLWWFSAADHDDLKEKAGKDFTKYVRDHHSTVVTVTPGHYRLTARNHILHEESHRLECARQDVWRLGYALTADERKKAAAARKKNDESYFDRDYLGCHKLALLPKPELQAMLEAAKKVEEQERAKAAKFELRALIERVGDCTGVNEHAIAEAANQEPPSFEEFAKICRLTYPGLYQTRRAVLAGAFLNSRGWNKGTLFDTSERTEIARKKLAAGVEVTFETNDPHAGNFLPISDYMAISRIPDDVKHDWLAAAFELLQLVIHAKPENPGPYCDPAENSKIASKIYGELFERFEEKEKVVKTNPDGSVELKRVGHYREELDPIWTWLQSRKTYPEMVKVFRDMGWTPENGRPKGDKKTTTAYPLFPKH